MGKVKNQHYVPQSYLSYFANIQEKIYVYDKETNVSFQTNIRNVASENYFYDFSLNEVLNVLKQEGKGDVVKEIQKKLSVLSAEERKAAFEQPVEHFFSQLVESQYKRLLDGIRTRAVMSPTLSKATVISMDEKRRLSYFLALQIVRSKEFRESHFETQQQIQQVFFDIFAKEYDENYKTGQFRVERSYQNKPLEHAALIFGELPLKLASILQKHVWFVGVNKTDLPFYTSDHPIVKYAHKHDPLMGTSGYGSDGIEIAVPVTSKLVLVMIDPKYHSYATNWNFKFIPLVDEENVVYYNSLQVYQSYRQVYCLHNEFSLVKKMKEEKGSIKRVPKQMEVNAFGEKRIY